MTMKARILLGLFALFSTLPALAQTQINPTTQIRWPMITGTGTPGSLFIACSSLNYGQPYQNLAVTPNTYYTCGNDGWQIRGGSGSAPAPPSFAVQLANNGATALAADPGILGNTRHIFS